MDRITKKERNLIINSEIIKDYPWLHDILKRNEKIGIQEIEESCQEEFKAVVPHILQQASQEWMGDESVAYPLEDMGHLRRPCGLCGTANRYIYYIQNKLNGNKLNVGSDCIEEFVDSDNLSNGLSRKQLIQRAREIRRISMIGSIIPGIENKINEWNNRIDRYDVVIPKHLIQAFLEDGMNLRRLFDLYVSDEDDAAKDETFINDIFKILEKEASYTALFDDYQKEYITQYFTATKEMLRWLKARNDSITIQHLQEDGKVTGRTVGLIWEKNYIEKHKSLIAELLSSISSTIEQLDHDNERIIYKIDDNPIMLVCSYQKFFGNFGRKLVGEHVFIGLNKANLLLLSRLLNDDAIEILLKKISAEISNWKIGISYNEREIERNQIYILDKKNQVYIEHNLQSFVREFKFLAFGIVKKKREDYENIINSLTGRRYTRAELNDIRRATSENF